MPSNPISALPRARVLGPGAVVTLEDIDEGVRIRVRVHSRAGRSLHVEPLPGSGVSVVWRQGTAIELRAARSFGLFCFQARVIGENGDGYGRLELAELPAKRRQLRGYFRMPVRLGVLVEMASGSSGTGMLRACNLSGSGILLLDPDRRVHPESRVRIGLPIGPSGDILRLPGRVVRIQEDPRRVGLCFDGITEPARQMVLRFLLRQHRRGGQAGGHAPSPARVTPLERP